MKKLLVIAGANVTTNSCGKLVTKAPMAVYLHQLSEEFDSCTWVANRYQNDDYLSILNKKKIKVLIVERGWFARIKSFFYLMKLALEHDYVLYYLPNPYFLLLPFFFLRTKQFVVYLAGDYEINIDWYASQRWYGWATLFRWSFELPMRYADSVIARGKKLALIAGRFNRNVYETIPLGHMASENMNVASFSDINNKIGKRILYIGKIVESKGIGDLIDAFQLLISKQPDQKFFLDLVGQGEDKNRYERTVKELNLDAVVKFHGWVSAEEKINQFFKLADVLVVPSIYPEGVPRVIDEAIIRGLPVVSTAVGGIGEEFCDNEILLVPAQNTVDLADAIEKMLFDASVREYHLQQAATRSEFFRLNGSAAIQHIKILFNHFVNKSKKYTRY